jgi:hypothetical protein
MTPAFKHRHLKELYPTFWSKTVELVQSLQYQCGTSNERAVIEVDDWVSRGTLDAIALAGFGFDFNSIAKPYSELVKKYRTAFLPGKSAARKHRADQVAVQSAHEEKPRCEGMHPSNPFSNVRSCPETTSRASREANSSRHLDSHAGVTSVQGQHELDGLSMYGFPRCRT